MTIDPAAVSSERGGFADRSSSTNLDGILRLALLNQETGMLAEAERLFSDALVAAEREHGPDSRRVASVLALFANAVLARDAFQEAEALFLRALAIEESQLGVDHPDLVVLLNDLGRMYLKQGAHARAEPVLQRLLALKRVKGDDHPEVATVLASLASVRRGVGDHEEAEQLCRRVLQIRERTLAPNHFAVAAALEHLAEACAARGKSSEALRYYQRALSIRQQTLGVTHPSLRPSRERIADLLLQSSEESMDAMPTERPAAAPWAVALPGSRTPSASPRMPLQPPQAPAVIAMAEPVAPVAPVIGAREQRPDDDARTGFGVSAMPLAEPLRQPALGGDPALLASPASMHQDLQFRIQQATDSTDAGLVASRMAVLRSPRVQAVAIGIAGLALVVSAVAAYNRADVDDERDPTVSQLLRNVNSAGTANAATRDQDSLVATTSGGALAPRRASSPPVLPPSTARRTPATGIAPASESGAAVVPSLELTSLPRSAAPNVATVNPESVVTTTAFKSRTGISKQDLSTAIEAATASSPSRETQGETKAQLIGAQPRPAYPDYLRRAGVKGDVVVQFVVDEHGRPDLTTFVVVQSPHELLTGEVRRVVDRMRFSPAKSGGQNPRPRSERVQIAFTFDDAAK